MDVLPFETPLMIAMPLVSPAPIVIVVDASATMFGALLDSVMSKPPAGAGGLMRIGSGALAPSGTVTGPRTIIAFETATVNVPCVKPDADARNIVLPSATPLTAPVACVWPEG